MNENDNLRPLIKKCSYCNKHYPKLYVDTDDDVRFICDCGYQLIMPLDDLYFAIKIWNKEC